MDKKINITEEVKGVTNLAESMKKFGRENTIIAFFMVIMTLFIGYNQYSNYKVMEDNRTYIQEQRTNMKEIVETNTKLVKILDTKISNIEESLSMNKNDSNTYILEEVIEGGEAVLKPRKIKQ